MTNNLLAIIIFILVSIDALGQDNITGQERRNNNDLSEANLVTEKYSNKRFTLLLAFPGLSFGKQPDIKKYNHFQCVGVKFDYNFTEIISLGFNLDFGYGNYLFLDDSKTHIRVINFGPVFTTHMGKNQMIVPYLEIAYILSVGNYFCSSTEEYYTNKYLRHKLNGGVGINIYASRWFKKIKYKNNFGIILGFSKALFLFDNSINVPILDRFGGNFSFFYKF
jgi:hypothetical protein